MLTGTPFSIMMEICVYILRHKRISVGAFLKDHCKCGVEHIIHCKRCPLSCLCLHFQCDALSQWSYSFLKLLNKSDSLVFLAEQENLVSTSGKNNTGRMSQEKINLELSLLKCLSIAHH